MEAYYSNQQRKQLLSIALKSIKHGLKFNTHMVLDNHQSIDPTLLEHRSCFVTLKKHALLRGCIGSLQAHEPLINNVVDNAYKAAFNDPRFPSLKPDELLDLHIDISVLSASQAMSFTCEQDLLKQLRPTIDGLILRENAHCATYLPSVWEQLIEPSEFLNQLKTKAGLAEHYWSSTVVIERYTVESFECDVGSGDFL